MEKIAVTVTYTPTDVGDEDIKDAYYSHLQSVIENVIPRDISIILTNANAMIASPFPHHIRTAMCNGEYINWLYH